MSGVEHYIVSFNFEGSRYLYLRPTRASIKGYQLRTPKGRFVCDITNPQFAQRTDGDGTKLYVHAATMHDGTCRQSTHAEREGKLFGLTENEEKEQEKKEQEKKGQGRKEEREKKEKEEPDKKKEQEKKEEMKEQGREELDFMSDERYAAIEDEMVEYKKLLKAKEMKMKSKEMKLATLSERVQQLHDRIAALNDREHCFKEQEKKLELRLTKMKDALMKDALMKEEKKKEKMKKEEEMKMEKMKMEEKKMEEKKKRKRDRYIFRKNCKEWNEVCTFSDGTSIQLYYYDLVTTRCKYGIFLHLFKKIDRREGLRVLNFIYHNEVDWENCNALDLLKLLEAAVYLGWSDKENRPLGQLAHLCYGRLYDLDDTASLKLKLAELGITKSKAAWLIEKNSNSYIPRCPKCNYQEDLQKFIRKTMINMSVEDLITILKETKKLKFI